MSAQQPNPYAPPTATVADTFDDRGEAEVAGRGARLGAYLLDIVVSIVFSLPALLFGGFGALTALFTSQFSVEAIAAFLTGTVAFLFLAGWLAWAVITIILVHRYGQTIGKKLVGIRVVRKDGSRASLGRIFWLRNVVNALPSMIPVVGGFYFFIDSLFIFTESNQCLHDKIADTIVIKA